MTGPYLYLDPNTYMMQNSSESWQTYQYIERPHNSKPKSTISFWSCNKRRRWTINNKATVQPSTPNSWTHEIRASFSNSPPWQTCKTIRSSDKPCPFYRNRTLPRISLLNRIEDSWRTLEFWCTMVFQCLFHSRFRKLLITSVALRTWVQRTFHSEKLESGFRFSFDFLNKFNWLRPLTIRLNRLAKSRPKLSDINATIIEIVKNIKILFHSNGWLDLQQMRDMETS